MYTDAETYASADSTATGLSTVGPSLTYAATGIGSTGPKNVSVNPVSVRAWIGVVGSASGKCFAIKETVTGTGTQYAKWTDAAATSCTGTYADASGALAASR